MERLLDHDLTERDEEKGKIMLVDDDDDESEAQIKCERKDCNFQKHSWQQHNYCCFKCSQNGSHGDFCEKFE